MRNLTATDRTLVDRWFSALPPREKRALRLPRRIFARFVEPDALAGEEENAPAALYEYLVNHEVYLTGERVFHICSAHPAATGALAAGHLPASFACPLDRAACPMRTLLAVQPGYDVRFIAERA